MAENPERSLEERLTALEAAVESLQRQLAAVTTARSTPARQPTGPLPSPTPAAPRPSRPAPSATPGVLSGLFSRGAEFWISRVGIGLLLLGLAFLFKYAVDQAWLTPAIRVAFGVALGLVLATIGLRVHGRKRWFAQIMLGGAAATWYVTGFAAFQFLHVVSFTVAFAFMVAVTAFTFWAALRQNESMLAVLAAIGGLGTPFFLYTETGSIPRLMAYTCLILVGTGAIHLVKGWRSLVWTTTVGSGLVVALAFRMEALSDRVALQTGIIAIWLVHWVVPTARVLLSQRNPQRWPSPAGRGRWHDAVAGDTDLAVLTFALPIIVLFVSRLLWGAGAWPWGVTALAGALLYALVARYLYTSRVLAELATVHGVTAATLLAIGLGLLFAAHVVFVLWAVEAAGLHLLAGRLATDDGRPAGRVVVDYGTAAHVLYLIVGGWLFLRMVTGVAVAPAVLNRRAAADAAVIALALFAAPRQRPGVARVYWLVAHLAILGWLARELSELHVGSGLVTVAWGAYALGLLLFLPRARKLAVGTLFLAVGKLILYDLSQVEPLWRILLFLGFGAVFLAVSYYSTDRSVEKARP